MNEFKTSDGRNVAIPHLDQYLGLWAHEPNRLTSMMNWIQTMNVPAHVAEGTPLVREAAVPIVLEGGAVAEYDGKTGLVRIGSTALIEIQGTITKYGSSLSAGASTVMARRDIARAIREKSISSILLRIDSPGGTVAGVDDLARDIAEANRKKRVVAYIEDLGASAAYYLASQAGRVYMNPTGEAGSIGVFMLVYDLSEMATQQGIKAVLIKAGEFKGAGAPGLEITDKQKAEWQRSVNEAYEQFVGAVARGRGIGMEQARLLADGRLWGASDAVSKRLVDDVATFADALDEAKAPGSIRMNRAVTSSSSTAATATSTNPLLDAVDALKAQQTNSLELKS